MKRLNVRIEGPADAPTLVLVHGLCESLRAWDKLVPELVDEFRILRLDLYGFGSSPVPQPPFRYAIEEQARGVALTLAATRSAGWACGPHSHRTSRFPRCSSTI